VPLDDSCKGPGKGRRGRGEVAYIRKGNSRKEGVVQSSTYDVTQLVLLDYCSHIFFSLEFSEIYFCHLMDDLEVKYQTFCAKVLGLLLA
jgi:hypothetical protein